MRPLHEYTEVLGLVGEGLNDCEISRRTGIPVTTVRQWRSRTRRGRPRIASDCRLCAVSPVDTAPIPQYAYLLGLYLGDGCISAHPRTYSLRIYLDGIYPGIIEACEDAMRAVLPERRVTVRQLPSRAVQVTSCSAHWLCLFPQHGPGRKHHRRIVLAPWQEVAVARYPVEMLRGLIHSDGCRSINRVKTRGRTYEYPRYYFRNASEDILRIFCAACDMVGVTWTRSAPRTVSVSRRASVARLDAWIGPKC